MKSVVKKTFFLALCFVQAALSISSGWDQTSKNEYLALVVFRLSPGHVQRALSCGAKKSENLSESLKIVEDFIKAVKLDNQKNMLNQKLSSIKQLIDKSLSQDTKSCPYSEKIKSSL